MAGDRCRSHIKALLAPEAKVCSCCGDCNVIISVAVVVVAVGFAPVKAGRL